VIAFFIHHRIATIMIFLAVCLAGVLSLRRLPVELLPNVGLPCLTVITPFDNASPEDVEQLITRHIEEAVSSTSGVDGLSSESMEGLSLVTARFRWGTDMDMALIETKEKADLARSQIPQDAGKSIVFKYDHGARPVMFVTAIADNGDFPGLRRRVEREIVPLLERMPGVAAVDVMGGSKRQININLDRGKLYAHSISLDEVIKGIGESNYSFPSGFIEKSGKEYLVRTIGEFRQPGQIAEAVAGRNEAGVPVLIRDLGSVEDGYRDRKCIIRHNGRDAVGIFIRKEPGANTIDVCNGVRAKLAEIESNLNGEFSLTVVDDSSVFIRKAVGTVVNAAVTGSFIVFAVLAFFLKSLRFPLIILTSLPVSVLGTFSLMYFQGLSINTMSLGGLALGVGMMVDAGIVVLESIAREERLRPGQPAASALAGTRTVILPVAASIFTTIIVFLPLVYTGGLSGILFGELALTVSFSLICSLACSVMLFPMLAASCPLPSMEHSVIFARRVHQYRYQLIRAADRFIISLHSGYTRVITFASLRPRRVLAVGFAAFLIGNSILFFIDRELFPAVDTGEFTAEVELPRGTSLDESSRFSAAMENLFMTDPGMRQVYAKIGSDPEDAITERASGRGVNSVFIHGFLKNHGTASFIEMLRNRFPVSDNVRVVYSNRDSIQGALFDSAPGDLTVEAAGRDHEVLMKIGNAVMSLMRGRQAFTSARSSLDTGRPELRVLIDRNAMGSLGLTVEDIVLTVRAAITGEIATRYREHDEEIDVRVRLRASDRADRGSLNLLYVKNADGETLPLGKIATVHERTGPVSIRRENQQRVNLITAHIKGNHSREIRRFDRALSMLSIPAGYELKTVGLKNDIGRAMGDMVFSFLLALLLVYMLLSSQFQSLKTPLIIMLSVPVSFLGASAALVVSGATLNINSGIGFVMLAGIVVNNGIMLFDGIERARARGLQVTESVGTACRERLVPILMTTLTTIFALLPLALGLGEGAELQRPLALTVIGGMTVSTALTMVLLPTAYLVFVGENLSKPGNVEP